MQINNNNLNSNSKTIYEAIYHGKNIFVDLFFMILSVAFLGVLSNIRINIWPVPITMQTFGVMLIAFFFGSRKGVLTILLYVLSGIVGFSVFSGNKSGIMTLMGPTGGYILGFLACVYFVGKMVEKGYGRNKKSVLHVMLLGNLIIYCFGLIGLWYYLGNVGIVKILMVGLVPFLIGDLIKVIFAGYMFPKLWKINLVK